MHLIPLFSEQECVSHSALSGVAHTPQKPELYELGRARYGPYLLVYLNLPDCQEEIFLVNLTSFSQFPLAILFILLYTKPIKDDLPLIRRVHRFGGAPGGKPTVSSCQVPSSRWFSPTAVTVTYCCTFTASPWLPTRVRIEGSPAFPEKERK